MPLRRSDDDTVRFVTNDFMYTGGDGYTVFTQGTNVLQTGDLLLDVVAAYIEAQPSRSRRSWRVGSPARNDPARPRSSRRGSAFKGRLLFLCRATAGVCAHRKRSCTGPETTPAALQSPNLSRKCMG